MRGLSEFLTTRTSVVESAVFLDDLNHRGDVVVANCLALEQALHLIPGAGRHFAQSVNERQRDLVLAEIESGRLACRLLLLTVIEQIVGDLECHAEILPESSKRIAITSGSGKRSELARGAHERGGLRANQIVVLPLRKMQRIRHG